MYNLTLTKASNKDFVKDGEPPAPAHDGTTQIGSMATHLCTRNGLLDLGRLIISLLDDNSSSANSSFSNPDLSIGALLQKCKETETSQSLLDFQTMITYARLACYVDRR